MAWYSMAWQGMAYIILYYAMLCYTIIYYDILYYTSCEGAPSCATFFATVEENLRQTSSVRQAAPPETRVLVSKVERCA